MAKIPKFESLEQAARFWDTHDFEDYVDDTEAVALRVRMPRRKKMLTVHLPAKVYEQLEALAAKRGVPLQDIVASWLKDKAMEGRRP